MNRSLLLKTLVVAALAVALIIPILMIQGLVFERQMRRNEAVGGIAYGWGARQTVSGPYLAMPYERRWTTVKQETVDGKPRETKTEHFESQVLRLPVSSVDSRRAWPPPGA
jgi:inner membrane protein